MKINVFYIIVVMFMTVLLNPKVGLTIDLLEDKRPPEVPPDAEVEVGEDIKEYEETVTVETNVTIERIHVSTALVGKEIEIILRVTNVGDEDVELALREVLRPGIDYLDPLEKRILEYQALKIPVYLWEMSLPAKVSYEIRYHIKSESPMMITFPAATASDQYGNQFKSEPTSITIVCNPDGKCTAGENFIFCPEDCTTGIADDMCDGAEDGKCDPDCTIEGDKGCSRLSDSDGDGVADSMDNCPTTANPGQIDSDGDGIGNACEPVKVSGGAYFYPESPTYRASFSMDVTGPTSPSGWLKYYYSRTRMNFVSTGITIVSVSDNTATISGNGTVNGVGGYTFTATVTGGTPDNFGITIKKSDGSLYYSAGPVAASGGDLVISLL